MLHHPNEAYAPAGASAAAAVMSATGGAFSSIYDGRMHDLEHASDPRRRIVFAAAKLAAEFIGPVGTIPNRSIGRALSDLTTRKQTAEPMGASSSSYGPLKRNSGTHLGARRGRSPINASGIKDPTGISSSIVRRRVMAIQGMASDAESHLSKKSQRSRSGGTQPLARSGASYNAVTQQCDVLARNGPPGLQPPQSTSFYPDPNLSSIHQEHREQQLTEHLEYLQMQNAGLAAACDAKVNESRFLTEAAIETMHERGMRLAAVAVDRERMFEHKFFLALSRSE